MNFDSLVTENVVLNIVKEKFRHDENVISVSENKKKMLFVVSITVSIVPFFVKSN